MKLTLVILTRNELVGLRATFGKIPFSAVDEIFAVDGGSTDGTLEFFAKNNISTHVQSVPGRGAAFRLAFEVATGNALIFFSPDGNEDPADIVKFRSLLEQGADIVIANRMTNGGHNEEDEQWWRPRKWANNIFTLMANITWRQSSQPYVADTINGFRAITKTAWQLLAPDGPGYTIEYQTSIRALKQGLKIIEFPTYEAVRIDHRAGSPSIATGLAFLRIYFRELICSQPQSKDF